MPPPGWKKVRRITTLLRRLWPAQVEAVVAMLSGRPRQGRVGLGPAAVRQALDTPAAGRPALPLEEVDRALDAIASAPGSQDADTIDTVRELLEPAGAEG